MGRMRAQARGSRRAGVVVAVPLALSAVAASAYAVVPVVTSPPQPAAPAPTPLPATRPAPPEDAVVTTTTPGERREQRPLAPVAAPPAAVPAEAAPVAARVAPALVRAVTDEQSSVDQVPAASLAAYQRAETIMGDAWSRCRLDWTVLAAVAELASDHGRAGASRVTRRGISRPAVVGAPLDGRRGRDRMRDTDAGELDGNERWDAPVGPMGLLPSAWSAVAVDADGNGRRNVQDVDDAALAVAVLVCHDARGRTIRAALRSMDPTPGYARAVLRLAREYRRDAAAVPVAAPVLTFTTFALPQLPEPAAPAEPSGTQPTTSTTPTPPPPAPPTQAAEPAAPPEPEPEVAPPPAVEPPVEEAPVEPPIEPPVEETPVEPPVVEPPVEEPPAAEVPVEPPVEEPPAEETPAEESVAEEPLAS